MRWWLLVALCGCDGYRPIDEIDKVACHSGVDVEVYGSVEVNGETLEFDDAFFPPQDNAAGVVFIQEGHGSLFLDGASGTGYAALYSQQLSATSVRVMQDCVAPADYPAGRFEAHFSTGDLSGWWRGGFTGW